MSTALQLLNRLRVKSREEEITAFPSNDPGHTALLNTLNDAVRSVLHERTWSFQHRTDGTLMSQPLVEDSTADASTTAGSAAATLSDAVIDELLGADIYGNFRASVLFPDLTNSGDTTYDVTSTTTLGTSVLVSTDAEMIDTGTSAWKWFVYQYTLPSTVSQITRFWHQETDISLMFEDEVVTFRDLVPKPHDQLGARTQIAMMGYIQKTANNSTGDVALGVKLWPAPGSTTLMFNYAYIYKQADLDEASDQMIGVPTEIEDEIVELAYANQLIDIQDRPDKGFPLKDRVEREISRKHKNLKLDPMRRHRLKSLDEIGTRTNSLNRTYHSVDSPTY